MRKVDFSLAGYQTKCCLFIIANERLCVRCGKRFMVNTEGMYLNDEKCIHHWGKLWKRKSK